jgi:alpha-mannosidase
MDKKARRKFMNQTIFAHKDLYERELENWYVRKFLYDGIKGLCYEKVLSLNVTFAYSDEPVPFEDIKNLEFKPIQVGEQWAAKNFACAWFHLTGKLPKDIDREGLYLDFSNSGEGLLVDKTGHSVKGFTAGSPIFEMADVISEKRYYALDDIIADEEGNIDVYIDGASNNLVGEYRGDGKLEAAAIVREVKPMLDLYFDYDVLLDYCLGKPFHDENKRKVLFGLRKIMNLISYNDPDYYKKAKAITKELFALAGYNGIQVTAVGHAHVDLAWLWPIRETKRKAKRTFASVVYLMKRYPKFHFVVPQPQQLAWMKELDPKLYEEIKQLAQEGRMEPVGGGWVENDTNVPCEESLVRQELYGQKFWQEEFGGYVHLRWLPDTFGYSAAIPQILKQTEQDYFMTIKLSWSNRTHFPYHTFHWVGIDGTDVIVHMPPEGTYNSYAGPRALMAGQQILREADYKDEFLMVYGIGDGGGGPSERMLERLERVGQFADLPRVQQKSAISFFEDLKDKDLPVYDGEMYLEKHRATYTSQSNNKNFNRDCEGKLLAYEQLLSCLGETGDKTVIDDIWKEVLLYQFHDILPGSSIQRVYDETDVAYAELLQKLEGLVNEQGVSFLPSAEKSIINLGGRKVSKIAKDGDKYLYYKGEGALVTPTVYENAKCAKTVEKVETDYYVATFAQDGSFESVVLKENGNVALKDANKLRVFIDKGDSWDFMDDYRDQPEVYMTLVDTNVSDFGELIEIKQNYVYKNSKLEQTIVMHKNEPIIRIHHEVNLVDDGHMIRAEFIPTAWSDTVYSDIQFGYLGRPTTDDTEHNAAQFEICCQKWFDVSDETQGFAVLNDAKCGFMAKQGIVSLNLVRSTVYPSIERDHVSYSYALYPHVGGFDPVALDEMAKEYNARALYGNKVLETPVVDNDQIDITAFKPAYDTNGYILRMFERAGQAAETKLTLPTGYTLDCEVNMLEDKIGEASEKLTFKPFQIRSFRVKRNR